MGQKRDGGEEEEEASDGDSVEKVQWLELRWRKQEEEEEGEEGVEGGGEEGRRVRHFSGEGRRYLLGNFYLYRD